MLVDSNNSTSSDVTRARTVRVTGRTPVQERTAPEPTTAGTLLPTQTLEYSALVLKHYVTQGDPVLPYAELTSASWNVYSGDLAVSSQGGAEIRRVLQGLVRRQPEMPKAHETARHEQLSSLLARVAEAERGGSRSNALDILYDVVDDELIAGRFDHVNDWLSHLDLRASSDEVLVTILTITFPWRERIRGRHSFLSRVDQVLIERHGRRRAATILDGLR
jgi:hypothetical protein